MDMDELAHDNVTGESEEQLTHCVSRQGNCKHFVASAKEHCLSEQTRAELQLQPSGALATPTPTRSSPARFAMIVSEDMLVVTRQECS